MRIGWDIFLKFYTYLVLIPISIVSFAIYYSTNPNGFIVNLTEGSSFKEQAINEIMSDLCLEGEKYNLVVSGDVCNFKYKQPLMTSNSAFGNLYSVKKVSITFKKFENKKLELRYMFKYDFHKDDKKKDIGIIQLDFEHYGNIQKTILLRVVPYFPYPEGNPLYEIEAKNKIKTMMGGPYKGLDILTLNFLNLQTDRTNVTSSKDWTVFNVIPSTNILKAYKLLHEGKPVLSKFKSRFWIFLYYSGITFMTVGYGDITPITTSMRSLAILESFLGVIFLGLFSGSFFAYIVNLFSRPWKEFEKYLLDKENWNKSRDPQTGVEMLYYIPKPDFKIIEGTGSDQFDEPWTKIYPDPQGRSSDLWVKYKDTILYNFRFVYCDGGRGVTILPNKKVMSPNSSITPPFKSYFYLIKDSFEYKLNSLVKSKYFSDLVFQFNEFKSEKEAESEITKSFNNQNEHLICFEFIQAGTQENLINGV